MYLYTDGVLNGTPTPLTGTISNQPNYVCIGVGEQFCDGTNYFNGDIDDVRIYNRALNVLEIQELYYSTGGT